MRAFVLCDKCIRKGCGKSNEVVNVTRAWDVMGVQIGVGWEWY